MRRMARKWKNSLPWTLLCCLILTAAMAAYTCCYEQDRYRASYSFFALPAQTYGDSSALELTRMLASDCQALAATEGFRSAVQARCETDGRCRVTVRGVEGAHVLEVEAVGYEPEMVWRLANAAGRELLRRVQSELHAAEAAELEPASLPEASFAPVRARKILWMLLGSFAACSLLGCAFGSARQPVRAGRGIDTPLPLYGLVSDYRADLRRFFLKRKKPGQAGTLSQYVNRLVKEDIRALALALRTEDARFSVRSLTVTSLRADEGKDSFIVLLASELAQQGFRVLVAELDGHSPRLGELLGVTARSDLYDYLNGAVSLREIILDTPVQGLSFIGLTHGPDAVVSEAASDQFARFLRGASQNHDFVLLSAPPALPFIDAATLGAVTDAVLLLAEDGRYDAKELALASGEMSRLARRLLGIALVRVPSWRGRPHGGLDGDLGKGLKGC